MSHSHHTFKHRFIAAAPVFASVTMISGQAQAHTSEGGFVLLLPTDMYIASGVLAVALTVAMLVFVPDTAVEKLFRPASLWRSHARVLPKITSLLSSLFLFWLVYIGLEGPRDPLANPMPLTIWTVWWVGLVFLQGLLGDLWRWINPWSGLVWLVRFFLGHQPMFRFPRQFGHVLGILSFVMFVAFLLADTAPSDPARLARVVTVYWGIHFLGMVLLGPRWQLRAEGIGMVMRLYAQLAPFGRVSKRNAAGLWGWQILHGQAVPFGMALLCLLVLGSGSFDGVNETFWWLAQLGLNPLEFPGRSAVVWQTLGGLVASNLLLVSVFAGTLWLGLKLGRITGVGLGCAFCLFAPTVLPIALGYHFAHYFTSFLVEAQYALIAATDPWATGEDFLGLGQVYVTTGFFNSQDSVRVLWLCQASGVVVGHIVAVLLAHAVAVRHFGSGRAALLSQVPLAIFMICYTFFGLWLLASPRGF
ncbi:hypothetical protein [uncultured Shimia sp.]|uniref:hypothetical protein n=1 Tax=uncultured Shimia sp. TaxID=573152 RepID=UPI0025DE8AB8|nr:hypothetical protein [uncultured Shimia sp.]